MIQSFLRGLCALATMACAAAAQPSSFSFQVTLTYDPNRVVSAAGGTLGSLMVEFFGPSALQGQVPLSGEIAYLTGQPPTAASANIAGYQTALTRVELRIGNNLAQLDLARVQQNAASSKVGLMVRADDYFCIDLEHCQKLGVRNSPWGTQGAVLNDIPNFLLDETGQTDFERNDVLGFMAGRTDAVGEFAPIFQTRAFGAVSLDGFALGLMSTPGTHFFDSRAMPPMSQLVGTQNIQRSEFWIFLEGPQLPQPVKVEGVVNNITLLP